MLAKISWGLQKNNDLCGDVKEKITSQGVLSKKSSFMWPS